MAYRWQAAGGPTLCSFWAGNFSFISAKTYDLGVKKNRLDERFLLASKPRFWLFSLNRKIVF